MSAIDEKILDSMARTLHVTAYAGAVQRGEIPEPANSAGKDWSEIAPITSKEAEDFARDLGTRVVEASGRPLGELARDAAKLEGVNPDTLMHARDTVRPQFGFLQQFGQQIALEATGMGTSWNDDHQRIPLKVPKVEFYPDFSYLAPAKDAGGFGLPLPAAERELVGAGGGYGR